MTTCSQCGVEIYAPKKAITMPSGDKLCARCGMDYAVKVSGGKG